MSDTDFPASLDIPRDRWGKPLIIPVGGGKPTPYHRASSFGDVLEDSSTLSKWKQRMTAIGITDRSDLRLSVAAHRDDKGKLDKLCEDALVAAGGSSAATVGTALHSFTEQYDRGELSWSTVPAEYQADIKAYAEALEPFDIVQIETFGVLDSFQVAGSWDRIVRYNGMNYIADLKTGKSVDFSQRKIAIQLAVYANSKKYDPATGQREELPDVDTSRALVIHLPAGSGQVRLVWVNIAAGLGGIRLASEVREWRKQRNLLTDFELETSNG